MATQPSTAQNASTAWLSASASAVPASSRAECMDSSGCPTSMVRMPSRVAVNGPMVDPQGQRVVGHELLGRHASRPAGPPPQRHAGRVGGVALVGVDLQQRAAVEQRLVGRVVPLWVVGVDGVAGVNRQADRPGQGLVVLVGAHAAGAGDAGEHVGQQRTRRAAPGRTAELLVVERHEQLDPLVPGRAEQGGQAGMDARQVVQPAGGQELVVGTEDGGGGGVVGHQVEPVDLVAATADQSA